MRILLEQRALMKLSELKAAFGESHSISNDLLFRNILPDNTGMKFNSEIQ